ncbi:MAG: hypothetical protein AVDCRST_MAG30-2637, partial [uncultured Solirubrobacteraceae bacterium]
EDPAPQARAHRPPAGPSGHGRSAWEAGRHGARRGHRVLHPRRRSRPAAVGQDGDHGPYGAGLAGRAVVRRDADDGRRRQRVQPRSLPLPRRLRRPLRRAVPPRGGRRRPPVRRPRGQQPLRRPLRPRDPLRHRHELRRPVPGHHHDPPSGRHGDADAARRHAERRHRRGGQGARRGRASDRQARRGADRRGRPLQLPGVARRARARRLLRPGHAVARPQPRRRQREQLRWQGRGDLPRRRRLLRRLHRPPRGRPHARRRPAPHRGRQRLDRPLQRRARGHHVRRLCPGPRRPGRGARPARQRQRRLLGSAERPGPRSLDAQPEPLPLRRRQLQAARLDRQEGPARRQVPQHQEAPHRELQAQPLHQGERSAVHQGERPQARRRLARPL